MNLYQIHDNARGNLDWEETTYQAIWADSPEEAIAIYAQHYEHDCTLEELKPELVIEEMDQPDSPQEQGPHIERRLSVLRLIGWRFEDEDRCTCCNLAAMGLDGFAVCHACDHCMECGHDEECEEHALEQKGKE